MNPAAYAQIKDDKKNKNIKRGAAGETSRGEKTEFSALFDNIRGKTADELGPLQNLPVSDESINALMDDVRDSGDILKNRPLPDEIMRYKQAVRNFINYVVQNCYSLDYEEGVPNKLKPGFKGKRTAPGADKGKMHTKISVIDKKLEDLAAMLLSSQKYQIELISRLEEIRGLLIDLLQ